jgi:hypothetical protein
LSAFAAPTTSPSSTLLTARIVGIMPRAALQALARAMIAAFVLTIAESSTIHFHSTDKIKLWLRPEDLLLSKVLADGWFGYISFDSCSSFLANIFCIYLTLDTTLMLYTGTFLCILICSFLSCTLAVCGASPYAPYMAGLLYTTP